MSHVTRTPLSRSKCQRSRSPGRFTHRRVGASGSCSGGRVNVLAVGNCCYVAVCSAARGASAPTGRRGTEAYRGGRPPTACFSAKRKRHGRGDALYKSTVDIDIDIDTNVSTYVFQVRTAPRLREVPLHRSVSTP